MKKLSFFLIAVFIYVNTMQSQHFISIHQDLSMLTTPDEVGNTPPTADVLLSFGGILDNNSFISFDFEYANLQTDFFRLSYKGGYAIGDETIKIIPYFGLGIIHHKYLYHGNFEIGGIMRLKLSKQVYISFLDQYMYRPEFKKYRNSGFVGIAYILK